MEKEVFDFESKRGYSNPMQKVIHRSSFHVQKEERLRKMRQRNKKVLRRNVERAKKSTAYLMAHAATTLYILISFKKRRPDK